ncbi:nucleoside hydrolase [Mesobacillus selenatarsenatis]|uniref:Inosine-uridine preferring nucleoside hydrolase n=1 Tax=Mesobacillus selenatarsenatis (strain DSM 18680 / JCM 14380 / FERM P-15431 / SF-1) TaxID=1321606 RepID=A0A0A8XAU4_MESS1|nr:nucleoside hydrolase [Mesobacillus selenatarsenatis]GAM15281.1 inosine-uridine preferring nucleoside hydrolase [Mesobacillus selenatarsenatis SF-1]
MMKKVLFFSDFGIDDNIAVLYAFFNKEIDLVGVVADYGNVSKQDALRNAAYLQKLTGRPDVPAFAGAELPLTGDPPEYVPDVHGIEGLGPIIPDIDVDYTLENFHGIQEIIEKNPDDIIIVNVGRLSSLAAAFILYPETMKKVKDFYIMGGAFNEPGNVTPVAEANFYGDPYAANIVLTQAKQPVKIIPLNVTSGAIVTPALINELDEHYHTIGSEVGKLVKPMFDYYYKFYKERDPELTGAPLHDVLTLWALIKEDHVVSLEIPVKIVVNKGEAFGQSIGDFRNSIDKAEYPVHKVAINFSYTEFIKDFFTTMKNSQVHNGTG